VKRLVNVYRAKRDAMLRGLWEVLEGTDVEISRPAGGFFIWIKLPSCTDPARLEQLALDARVQYTPGEPSSRTAAASVTSGSRSATSSPTNATRVAASSRRRSSTRGADSTG